MRYDGPLVVLTSRFSASASEIVAGALQDYGRAVVVGDPSTFGKGTVQTIVPLAPVMDQAGLAHAFDPGALKVTISKFYRPSGASTELRGVGVRHRHRRRRAASLPVGEVEAGRSAAVGHDPRRAVQSASARSRRYLAALRDASARRVAADPAFDDLRKAARPPQVPAWTATRSR